MILYKAARRGLAVRGDFQYKGGEKDVLPEGSTLAAAENRGDFTSPLLAMQQKTPCTATPCSAGRSYKYYNTNERTKRTGL